MPWNEEPTNVFPRRTHLSLRCFGGSLLCPGTRHLGHATKEDTPTYNGYNLWFGKLLGGGDHWTHVKSHRWSSCIGDGSNNRAIGYDMRRCQGDALETVYNASGIFTTDLFTMNAVDAIRLHDTKKSAFIYMAYTAPHSPLQAPPAFLDRVSSAYDTLPRRKTIAAMMAGIDSGIDDLITALREKDMWMDTITVVMSDNGGMATGRPAVGQYSPQLEQLVHSNYPLRGFKGGFFEGGTRTVGLLYTYDQHVPYARGWRPLSPAMVGQAFDGIMFIGDWVPTLADAAGLPEAAFAEPDADIDGVSLWSAFADGAPPPRKELLYSVGCKIRIEGSDSNRYNCGAIRVGNLKWIQLRRVKYKEGWSPPDFQSDDARSTLRSRLGLSLGISCPATDHQPDATECIDNPCLFNVRDDPCERNNLAAVLPEDLAHIQARLFELGDKYTQVRESKEFDAEGCTAISSGAWGLWLDQDNHDICQDETGLQRFSFSSNVHPATAADEVVPTNNQHQCALQCLAGSRCTGFFFEPEVVDANARVDLANIAGSLNQDWIGAPEGSCHLYRPQITLETMVAASTGGFYSLTSCNRRCNGPMLERFRAYPKTRPKWASRFMSTVAGVTLEACAQECVGTFGCKSFTFKPSTAVIGSTRCQLYEKVFRTALLVDHASKDYYTKRGDCMDPCPLNQIERFVRLPQSRPVRLLPLGSLACAWDRLRGSPRFLYCLRCRLLLWLCTREGTIMGTGPGWQARRVLLAGVDIYAPAFRLFVLFRGLCSDTKARTLCRLRWRRQTRARQRVWQWALPGACPSPGTRTQPIRTRRNSAGFTIGGQGRPSSPRTT